MARSKVGRPREAVKALKARGAGRDALAARQRRAGTLPDEAKPPRRIGRRPRELSEQEVLSGIPGYDPRLHAGGRFAYDHARALKAIRFFHDRLTLVTGARPGTRFSLQPWQQALVGNLFGWVDRATWKRRYRHVFLYVAKKNGKALALDTPIPTPCGWTTMGAIAPGDTVFDERGRPCRVLAASGVQHGRDCYRVSFSDGTSIVADAEHLWRTEVLANGYAAAIATTRRVGETLVRGDGARNHSIPVAAAIETEARDLPIPPYALGYWLGNGSKASAQVTLDHRDAAVLSEIEGEGLSVGVMYRPPHGNGGTVTVSKPGVSFKASLRALGVLGRKHIPPAYLRAAIVQRLALLRGLMDSDGCATKAGQCEWTTATPALRDGFLELARSLGFKPTFGEHRAMLYGRDCGPYWRVQFWAWRERPVFSLDRKRARLRPMPSGRARSSSRQVVAVEPVASVPVRCIRVDSPSRLYLAGEGMVPTHNSELAAGVMLYVLAHESEDGIRCFSLAASRDQTNVLFEPAAQMIRNDRELRKLFVIYGNSAGATNKSIVSVANALSTFRGLPHDADTSDGVNPHFVFADEIHRYRTGELLELMLKGMVSRALRGEPCALLTTTADSNRPSACNEWLKRARSARDNRGPDQPGFEPRLLPVLYEAAPKDDWTSPATWLKANPSLGVTVCEEALAEEVRAIRQEPSRLNDFLRLHCNIVTDTKEAAIPLFEWDACPSAPPSDAELAKAPAFGGLDISAYIDLTSLALWWPSLNYARWWFWIPRRGMLAAEDRDRVPYSTWARQGLVEVVDGEAIDHDWIQERVYSICVAGGWRVKDVGYDPWNCDDIGMWLASKGVQTVRTRQGHQTLGAASKALEAAVVSHKLNHGGNPVARWNAGNLAWRRDANGNICPDKGERPNLRIDGMVALVIAMSRALAQPAPKPKSVYERRGPIVV